jgi:hypothetical protein
MLETSELTLLKQTLEEPDPIGQAYSSVRKVLLGLSGRDRLAILRMAAGEFGHRVLPGLGTAMQLPYIPKVGQKPKAPAQPKSSKTAEQKEIQAKIKEINLQIKAKSIKDRKPLPKEDALIQDRNRLFRALHDEENSSIVPQSGTGE